MSRDTPAIPWPRPSPSDNVNEKPLHNNLFIVVVDAVVVAG